MDEDNEPEFIESDLGDLIVNPYYNNEPNDENQYNKIKHQLCDVEIEESSKNNGINHYTKNVLCLEKVL